jgi:hypothetical protein
MQITLSERGREIAELAVREGQFPSVEAAVEHALVLLALDAADEGEYPEWDAEYAAEVNRKLDEAEDDIRAGRVIVADAAYWERGRERIREAGRAAERG